MEACVLLCRRDLLEEGTTGWGFRTNIDYFSTNINLSVFITEADNVYCSAPTEFLHATDLVLL